MERPIGSRPDPSMGQICYEVYAQVLGPDYPGIWPEWRDLPATTHALYQQRGLELQARLQRQKKIQDDWHRRLMQRE